MTMSLDHLPPNSTLRLRSYRDAATFLVQSEQRSSLLEPLEPCSKEPLDSPPCGSPPRFLSTSSPPRGRSRTLSSPSLRSPRPSRDPSSKKVQRISSPGPSSSSPGSSMRRRVHWAHDLIASVHVRPRTSRHDIPLLYYSKADEKRFRRQAEIDVWCEEPVGDAPPAPPSAADEPEHKPLWSPQRERRDYAISKAVIVFGETTKTYGGSCALEAALESNNTASVSFDDAAFWNGVLTWS